MIYNYNKENMEGTGEGEEYEKMKQIYKKIEKYDICYIVLLILIFLTVYLSIILSGRMYMFIDIGADTYCNNWPSIAYAKDLLSDIKLWDMRLGLGASTVIYISNILSDPFNWICFFFKKENMDIGIFIGLILKNICLSYYAYRYIEKKGISDYKRVICSLMIVFCGWFVGWGQHYPFATVFLYFVAILYYFECWMQEKLFVGLALSTTLLAIASPYYCYMTLLFLIFYYFVSLYYTYKTREVLWKEMLLYALKTAGIFIIGLGCSGVVFLPYTFDTLSSPRVGGGLWPSLIPGSVQEYFSIVLRIFSNSILGINGTFVGVTNFYECPFMYIGVVAVLLLPMFLIKKKLRKKYWVVIIATLLTFVFINFSAPAFNAFSTKSYRWTYLFTPVLVVACGKALEGLETKSEGKIILSEIVVADIILFLYYFWYLRNCESDKSISISVGVTLILLNAYGLFFLFCEKKKFYYIVLLIIVSADLCINAFITVHDRSLIAQDSKETMDYFDDSKSAVDYLKSIDSSFYRINKNYAQSDLNDSMFQEYNGEKWYTPALSAEMWDMMELFELRVKNSNYFYGFDDKQILRDLAVGKYRFTKTPGEYFGYKLINNIGDVYIYENKYAVNFGVLYDSYVVRENLNEMDSVQLQSVLLDSCIIQKDECDEEIKKLSNGKEKIREIASDLGEEVKVVSQEPYTLKLDMPNRKPLILEISGENLRSMIDVYTEESDTAAADSISCFVESGKQTYYIDNLNIATIMISNVQGVLSDVRLYEIETEDLDNRLNNLKNDSFQTTYFSDTYISGYTECENKKILFLPIPYNKNWHVSVNGVNTKIYRVDAGFMAVIVPKGYSEIAIQYKSKAFLIGSIMSAISLIGLSIIVMIAHKKESNI